MADVTRDRAQLILVSGLLIAITLLVLVLLLNTVIYTGNVATRGIDSDASEAIDYQRMLDAELGAYFEAENAHNDAETWDALENITNSSLTHVLAQRENRSLERAHIATADIELTPGLHAEEDELVTLDDRTIAADAEIARELNLTIDDSDLTDEPILDLVIGDWTLHANYSTGAIELTEPDGTNLCGESSFSGIVEIDLINETVLDDDGVTECTDDFLGEDGTPPAGEGFEISLETKQATVNGKYRLVGKASGSESYGDYTEPVVYSADIDLVYVTAELRYETSITVEGVVP